MRYLKDIKEGEAIIEHYLCKQKQTLKSRGGKSYLSLKLQDKTGIVDAKVWDLTNEVQSFEENNYIKIEASATIYQNEIQLTVKRIRKSREGEYDPSDYIPSTQKSVDEMYEGILSYIKAINNKHIRKLLENIFIHNSEIQSFFKSHSAAKAIHHNYMGGLLEHTLAVVEICDFLGAKYKHVNKDILLSSAMLHDIGKIWELSEFPINDYTDCGQLLGHIMLGVEFFTQEANKIDGFPAEIMMLIKHCLISHHGEYEYGSPKLPKTIEAFIMHCADNADAKIKIFEEMLNAGNTMGRWVGYHKMLNRNIRKSDV